MYGCPFVDWAKTDEAAKAEACAARKPAAIEAINSAPTDLVIVADTYLLPERADTKSTASAEYWGEGLTAMLKQVNASETLIISAPPSSEDVKSCYTPASSPTDCITTVSGAWMEVAGSEQSAAAAVGGTYVDTRPLFCVTNVGCPAFAGSLPTKRDLTHPTLVYAEHISAALRELIVDAGVSL